MKYLKFLLINVIVFGMLFFGISLLFPSASIISKSVNISGNYERSFAIIRDSAQAQKWNSLYKLQSANSSYAEIKTDTSITISIKNNAYMLTDTYVLYMPDSLQTIITWKREEALKWYTPFKKFKAMVTNKSIAAEMDSSLNKLKLIIEK